MRRRQAIRFVLLLLSLCVSESVWAQLKPGIVVENVAKYSEGEKAGLREGDVLLSWSRGDATGELASPFDLSGIEIGQAPRGSVTLDGLRGTEKRVWVLGPDDWSIKTRPDLPANLVSIYLEGQELAKAGKLTQAAEHWRAAALDAEKTSSPWLSAWFFFHSAEQLADARQWKEADAAYQESIQRADAAGPAIATQLLRAWAISYEHRDDLKQAEKHYQQAIAESQQLAADPLLTASLLGSWSEVLRLDSQLPQAEEHSHQALAIQQKIAPDSLAVARTLATLGLVDLSNGDFAGAEDYERHALTIREKLAPGSLSVAISLYYLGVTAWYRGDFTRAEEYERQALEIQQRIVPDSLAVASTFNDLGVVAENQGELAKAEDYHRKALAIREKLAPGSLAIARSLNNLGLVARERGDSARAGEYLTQAMALDQKFIPDSLIVAIVLTNLGEVARDRGDDAAAERCLRQALVIQEKQAPNGDNITDTLDFLADIFKDAGDLVKAEEYYLRALSIRKKESPDNFGIAESLHHLGDIASTRGDLVNSEAYYRQAGAIFERQAPQSSYYAGSLAALAGVMCREGRLDAAAQLFDQAITVLESQMALLGGTEETRSQFRAKRASYYKDYVDLLITQKKPELAFQVVERLRARTLLEMLAGAHVDIRKGVEPSLVERERLLQQSFGATSHRRIQLLSDKHTEAQLAALDKEIKDVLGEYQDVEEQIRASSPAYAALTQSQPLNAKEVQQQLLDADTLLLEYSLGNDHSYVFAVSSDSLAAYQLPKQGEIESLARKAYDRLTARSQIREGETTLQKKARIKRTEMEYAKTVAELGQILLRPLASQLKGKRLLIVSDGALQYIPFSILPDPENSSRLPLMADHEIVNLPSASVLAILRREQMGRKQPLKAVAVLADPVFTARDARVGGVENRKQSRTRSGPETEKTVPDDLSEDLLTRSARDLGFLYLPRLPFTRQEADAIMAVTPVGEGMEALDFKASRDLSMSRELANYRMVHLATHGLADSEHPELSGLVLSLVDKQGKRQNGFLGLQDIYNLDLPVELVVLSACETGLGKEISGEGLIGLTRGFMYAGASRVVASLWSVDDVATAELMSRFYRGILRQGLSPAAALREAQVQMWRQKRWRDPYYWGAFVMQGEWKPENRQRMN